jgi:hypothetical protein
MNLNSASLDASLDHDTTGSMIVLDNLSAVAGVRPKGVIVGDFDSQRCMQRITFLEEENRQIRRENRNMRECMRDLERRLSIVECMPPTQNGGPEFRSAFEEEFGTRMLNVIE